MAYGISGKVRDQSNSPVEGILVKAYDMDPFYDDLLGSATTDGSGAFEISLTRQTMTRLELKANQRFISL